MGSTLELEEGLLWLADDHSTQESVLDVAWVPLVDVVWLCENPDSRSIEGTFC